MHRVYSPPVPPGLTAPPASPSSSPLPSSLPHLHMLTCLTALTHLTASHLTPATTTKAAQVWEWRSTWLCILQWRGRMGVACMPGLASSSCPAPHPTHAPCPCLHMALASNSASLLQHALHMLQGGGWQWGRWRPVGAWRWRRPASCLFTSSAWQAFACHPMPCMPACMPGIGKWRGWGWGGGVEGGWPASSLKNSSNSASNTCHLPIAQHGMKQNSEKAPAYMTIPKSSTLTSS